MAKVLGIGTATLDIINTVEYYPTEDEELRVLSQRRCVGGNCPNTLTVLQQLSHKCVFAGIMADDPDGRFIAQQLKQTGVKVDDCRVVEGRTPTSYITLSRATGTRTIVHYRALPEFSFADFAKIDLSSFDWLHFEGRNITETLGMLTFVRKKFPYLPWSVEIEKPRANIENLFEGATILLFSRHYAAYHGYAKAQTFLQELHSSLPHTEKVCAWGKEGAYALGNGGEIKHAPAFFPPQVVDTLGAGDTFNAGFLNARLRNHSLSESLTLACQLAGRKCGQQGFNGLGDQR
ncbi:ketohexokinase [Nitrosococcus oceani ATCC 19707]|uniref:Ketohexokinase n=2 Tax=Nitrosococcus oceani TaxID=1229 RepID=Q3J7A2_NITOC|nr:PfkB family carbohydrate kinase [Nitrosococcus oceani]ABA59294.1 ketohexokinase [Nitrosococcus oceani ATCC 19707]EDZ65998.1 kinase, pfkB family [Nitrosococcus oceani AFC27]KFI18322.1 ketohexokinase [Nitrosococcus oceani C-27]GEM21120.1 ketohexokinase [Nitrosococcus oceani]